VSFRQGAKCARAAHWKVIREMLGENYNRVLTSDRWRAYTWIKRRSCAGRTCGATFKQ